MNCKLVKYSTVRFKSIICLILISIFRYMSPMLTIAYLYSKMSDILRDLMNVPAVCYSQDVTLRFAIILLEINRHF